MRVGDRIGSPLVVGDDRVNSLDRIPQAKYKAKQVSDTFFKRAGDTMSAALVWTTVHFTLGTRTFLAVNVALSLAWVGLAVIVGRGYMRRSTTTRKGAPAVATT